MFILDAQTTTYIIIYTNNIITKSNLHNQYQAHSHTYNINLEKRITLTIHKHVLFTLRVENTCNKSVQDLNQGVQKNIFKNKLKY